MAAVSGHLVGVNTREYTEGRMNSEGRRCKSLLLSRPGS